MSETDPFGAGCAVGGAGVAGRVEGQEEERVAGVLRIAVVADAHQVRLLVLRQRALHRVEVDEQSFRFVEVQ